MDLGREDRDDAGRDVRRLQRAEAAMDLGREDRDDAEAGREPLRRNWPQWISVARTETTASSRMRPNGSTHAAMDLGREDRDDQAATTGHHAPAGPQWISVARTETTGVCPY